jgi:hypothetical protein
MKQHMLMCLIFTSLVIAGCSSQPSRHGGFSSASGPESLLPDGGIEEARLLAMGMARSKGWTIVASDANRLLLERTLPENSPQAQMLSPEGALSAPKLQVETGFKQRGNGVLVNLSAYLIANPGTDQERRIDYTNDYQNQLLISLNALASGWLENRGRIASEIPTPPEPGEIAVATDASSVTASVPEIAPETASAATGGNGVTASRAIASLAADEPSAPTASSAPAIASPAAAASDRASGDSMPSSTGRSDAIGAQRAAAAPLNEDAPAEPNPMLALDGQARRGLWTFYAEASARERGCAVGERGAVLLTSDSASELYEVACQGAQNLLLRCQGGVCRTLD